MALAYTEGRSLLRDLHNDIGNAILASTDWARLTSSAALFTSSASIAAGAGSITTTANPVTLGLQVGSIVRLGERGAVDCEYKAVTAVSTTTISFAATVFAHPSGCAVYDGHEIFKATTTRGADMVFDLNDNIYQNFCLQTAAYTSAPTVVGGTVTVAPNKTQTTRYLTFKGIGGGAINNIWIYWAVSVSKEHVFITLEGPRNSDANPDVTNFGSAKTYMFMMDLVPYFNTGTDPNPAVVMYMSTDNAYKSVGSSHKVWTNFSIDGSQKWSPGYLATLDLPGNTAGPFAMNRTGRDGNLFLSPYVLFDDYDGIRGRLASAFYAGPTVNTGDYINQPVAIGTYATYGGVKYKLVSGNKNNTANGGVMAGPLGWFYNNAGAPAFLAAPLVAIPST